MNAHIKTQAEEVWSSASSARRKVCSWGWEATRLGVDVELIIVQV